MSVEQIVKLVVIGFAIVLAWNLWRGQATIHLYFLCVLVLLALATAAMAQILDLMPVIEPASLAAIGLSLAGCTGGSVLWQQEMRRDLEGTQLYRPLLATDLLSWRGWLKAVDRIGAGPAAVSYLALFALAIAGVALTVLPSGPAGDRTAAVVSLAPTAFFAVLSAWYLYRGVRHLVPGA